MSRVYNFSAGPSMLPESVLKTAAAEMLDYNGSGQSVMEMSHRSKVYEEIIKACEASLREVMNIPDNYKVLFLQGGASSQFAMVPLNLMNKNNKADFVVTGQWAKKAYAEAARYGKANVVASSADKTFSYIPKLDPASFDPEADYFHICLNNTIYGTKYHELPDTGSVPLVADISSCALSEPIDVSKFGLLYAGAQKNMAPAGLTVAIVDRSLAGHELPITPVMYSYQRMIDKDSMYNTPPCWCIYILGLVLAWLERQGGVEGMQQLKHARAAKVYDFLDNSALFHPCAQPGSRSDMNVTFRTGDDALDKEFISGAAARGLLNLKGHRVAGGMRASLYNAMPMAGVDALVDYLKQFEVEHHV